MPGFARNSTTESGDPILGKTSRSRSGDVTTGAGAGEETGVGGGFVSQPGKHNAKDIKTRARFTLTGSPVCEKNLLSKVFSHK